MKAIIHFVGLITFMTLPRGAQSIAQMAANVETHIAVIAFPQSDYIDAESTWKATELWRSTSSPPDIWLHVRMSGEYITFETGAANPRIEKIGLPRVADLVGGGNRDLLPGYKPPFKSAAAVVELPGGVLRPCRSNAQGVTDRTDTEVTIKNSGKLKIVAGNKVLTLNGNAKLYIANVPPKYASRESLADGGAHHFSYCAMVNGATVCNPPRVSKGTDPCTFNDLVMPGSGATTPVKIPEIFYLTSFECSNTQWP